MLVFSFPLSFSSCLHGADVLQGLHSIIVNSTLKDALSPTLKFAALSAALVHDIGHPGRNNKFLCDEEHLLAIKYHDRSVLENFHIATALEISNIDGCNIFGKMESKETYKEIRQTWIDMILDTDMARHFTVVKELNAKIAAAAANNASFSCSEQPNHAFTLSVLLHCCDLGNPTKKFEVYQQWTSRVMEEFHSQAETEFEAGRKPSMPRNDDKFNLPNFQKGFLRFIRPFFVSVTIIDGVNLSELIQNLDDNLKEWDEIARLQEEEKG